ncbi:MAG: 4Fe-4S dicluster domain-containing protein [Candidatus Electrothrix sp. AUS1_2]|nr:4Fe-4S dicluster domain-containing protein [Candidatus Electrothrix sp. AUS1_2]
MKQYGIDQKLHKEVEQLGARDMELCMQCGICAASCPLSDGTNSFPRKIYRYLQLGLKDKLLASPEPWLCYYCGDCNTNCPRGAEPAETMMAVRRWMTTEFDRTGLAKRLYLSKAWEIGSLLVLSLSIIFLFVFFHGPMLTDRVSVNTFAPVLWIEIGDLLMVLVLSTFLFMNVFRMYRFIMGTTTVPIGLFLSQAKEFLIHFVTQKRWGTCAASKKKINSRWIKHFFLVTGYMTKLLLIVVFLRWFQRDTTDWHISSLFGYYAAGTIMFFSGEMLYSRYKKKEESLHRYSHATDWLFLILLFLTSLSGTIMHMFRMVGWATPTYVMYVVHLAIAVPMLIIEVPFGKWSHLFYRPFAIFLTSVKEKATQASEMTADALKKKIDENFMACMQCGICTTVCPVNNISSYSPRQVLRAISLDAATVEDVDLNAWNCVSCNSCVANCPRGIEIIDVTRAIRQRNIQSGQTPDYLQTPLRGLKERNNPWQGDPAGRSAWAGETALPAFTRDNEYCLFTCCTTAYDNTPNQGNAKAGQALNRLLKGAEVSAGSLGDQESCCGDPAHRCGDTETFHRLAEKNTALFTGAGVEKMLTTSPHCLTAFRRYYNDLNITAEHYTELLWRFIEEGTLRPVKELRRTVTYHDPCYLGRYNGIYDAPRRIIRSLPGMKLVEMQHHREQSLCCGGGGGGLFKPQAEESLGTVRVQEAIDMGAEIIAVACPSCLRMLNQAVCELGYTKKIAVCDIAELVEQSLG